MPDVHDSSDPVVLPIGGSYATNNTLEVFPGTGNVQVQLWDYLAEDWYTPAADEHTISERSAITLSRQNRPTMRILAIGDATFVLTGPLEQ